MAAFRSCGASGAVEFGIYARIIRPRYRAPWTLNAGRKTFALAAVAFVVAFAILTCSVHFASLTVGRQLAPTASPLLHRQLSFGEWPSLALCADLLAWDFFLGMSLMMAAQVFKSAGLKDGVRWSMILAGTLCLAGTRGPATGQLHIQYFGIAGYSCALPVVCTLLAILFRAERDSQPN